MELSTTKNICSEIGMAFRRGSGDQEIVSIFNAVLEGAFRRGSGEQKVARRETSGSIEALFLRAGGAHRILRAPPVRAFKNDLVIQRFHLWLPSLRIADAQNKIVFRLCAGPMRRGSVAAAGDA
jgi:hypothetical protein